MLSISPPARGAGKGDYYLQLAREDYYTKGGEPQGRWLGDGAAMLGLRGEVKAKKLRNVMRGYDPSGQEALVQNAGAEDRQCFWDLTFSCPKSVSVAWSQADRNGALEIQAAQREAVNAAIKYLEDNCAVTRRGKGGLSKESVKLVVAAFEHGTSRAQDPQLHTHCLVQNLGIRADGTTGTITSKNIFQNQMVIGALYRTELAAQLEKRLGLVIEKKGRGFELKGVSEGLAREFSKRRIEIEKELEARGQSSLKAADIAALNTRGNKKGVSRKELFDKWQEFGRNYGWSQKEFERLLNKQRERNQVELEKLKAVGFAVKQITEQRSFFSRKELMRFAAEEGQGRGLRAAEIVKAVDSSLQRAPEIVSLGLHKGEKRYTTREMLELEKELLTRVVRAKSNDKFVQPKEIVGNALKKHPTISQEQRAAVEHLTQERGRYRLVSGMAGTGKSFMLGAARECWEKGGFKVMGAALAGKAAQGLFEGSGIKSDTVHGLLSSLATGREELNSKTVLVLDEAAMVGTKQLSRVVDYVEKAGAKLVLVGDERQIQSIQAGGAFSAISKEVGQAELKENRRQDESWTKRAVELFSQGRSDEALREYAKRGFVEVRDSKRDVLDTLIEDWKKLGQRNPQEHLILASEKGDVSKLNSQAQSSRKLAGEIGEKCLMHEKTRFFKGDRVLITRNSRMLGVKNGQLGTVKQINKTFGRITLALDSGRLVSIRLKHFPHIELGYAVTTHKAQGMTAQNTYILAGGSMQDREITYVQASRGKKESRFYIGKEDAGEELKNISRQMSASRIKELALTILMRRNRGMEYTR